MKRKVYLLIFIAFLLFNFSSEATIVYVDSAHIGGVQNGTSWATAFSDFQTGIDAANAGDSVWVAKGTYQTLIDSSFKMKEGVKILGGFLNIHNNFSQRNWQSNKTILKGRNSGISFASASSSVILNINNNLTNASVIDGFTITGGYATNGGGIRNNRSSPTISNCTFTQNEADVGAGIFCGWGAASKITNCIFDQNHGSEGIGIASDSSDLVIINCIFSNNFSTGVAGGGIFSVLSNMIIKGCTFLENTGAEGGGGISSWSSSSVVDSCFFTGNTVGSRGGGAIYISQDNNTVIRNCVFNNNIAESQGGAIAIGLCDNVTLEHNIFYQNSAIHPYGRGGAIINFYSNFKINNCSFIKNKTKFGGAFFNYGSNGPTITNCLFAENIADSFGAAIYNQMDFLFNYPTGCHISNCTFAKNISLLSNGGTIYNDSNTSVAISNSIIWGNTDGVINHDATSFYFTNFSLIQGIAANPTTQNLDGNTNPLFIDTTTRDYRLRFDSPCINNGNNDSIPSGILTDIAGNNRIAYDTVDMGAYEYKLKIALGNDTLVCNANGLTLNADNTGSSYLWNTGETTPSIEIDTTGTYIVEVSNTWGIVTDTIQVNISVPPIVTLGNDITIDQGSSIILDAGNLGATYLWNTGATTQTITVNTDGIYNVAVTNSSGCTGADTILISVNPIGIDDINTSQNQLSIFPNPAKETIHINFTDDRLLHAKAMLMDIYGRTAREVMLNSKSQQLSMAGLSSGIYILKTITGNSVKIIKE